MIPVLFEPIAVRCLAKCDPAKTGLSWSIFLPDTALIEAVQVLYANEYFLEDITAIDAREGYLVVYHFDHMAQPERVALRVLIPHAMPELPSIASVFQGAEWHERETTDFYGIKFIGNPNPVPLLLPDDMTEHPLQKDAAARASLADLLSPCEVLRSEPGFDLLTAPVENGEESGPK